MFLPPPQPNLVQSGLMNPAGLGLSNLGNQPWPQTGLGFGPSPLGGLPPHPFAPLGPSLGPSLFAPLGSGPPLGSGGAPGFQRSHSPPQEKPLQLNQLPGFNLFNVSNLNLLGSRVIYAVLC